MSFDWCPSHTECNATFFIIVTIVETHMLIIDVCVLKIKIMINF